MAEIRRSSARSYSSSHHQSNPQNMNGKTIIMLPNPAMDIQGQYPESMEMSVKFHLKQPNQSYQSSNQMTNSYQNMSYSTAKKQNKHRYDMSSITKCQICQQNIQSKQFQLHYFQHKLCGSTKISNSRNASPKAFQTNSSNHKYLKQNYDNSIQKNDHLSKKLNFSSVTKISQYNFYQPPTESYIPQKGYGVMKTTELPLDQLIQNIKLQNNKIDNIPYNKYETMKYHRQPQPSTPICHTINSQRYTINNPDYQFIKNQQYNFDRISTSKTQPRQPTEDVVEYKYPKGVPGLKLRSIKKTSVLEQKQTNLKSNSTKKLTLSKDLPKQSHASRIFDSKKQIQNSKFYNLERENSRKRIFNSCTKEKIPINIFAQQEIAIAGKIYY